MYEDKRTEAQKRKDAKEGQRNDMLAAKAFGRMGKAKTKRSDRKTYR